MRSMYRPRRVHRVRAEPLARADLGDVGGEEPRDLDHWVAVFERSDRERHDDGVVICGRHCLRDGCLGIGHDVVAHVAQVDLVAPHLPPHDAVRKRLTAVAGAVDSSGNLRVPEEFFVQRFFRNFVEELFLDLMNGEDAFPGLGVLGDDLVVGLWFQFWRRESEAHRRRSLCRRFCRRRLLCR